MINFFKDSSTNTFAVYPDVTSSIANEPLAVYTIELQQDYDKSITSFTGSLVNTPSRVNPRLIFQVSNSVLPDYNGFYTFTLRESLIDRLKWGTTNSKWSLTNVKWSETTSPTNQATLDTERAKVSGGDTIVFTEYQSSNETGEYTTYHL